MTVKPILMVIGGQWGSEAKGAVAAKLCLDRDVRYVVRTGAVNAGHTVYGPDNAVHKMQQLPTGWVNPRTRLVVGAGAYINPDILLRELGQVRVAVNRETYPAAYVDPRAGLHLAHHTNRSTESGRHQSMGATGKGCSEAIVDKIRLRGSGQVLTFGDYCKEMWPRGEMQYTFTLTDTELLLNTAYDNGEQILLEATQGQMLDMLLGPYPYTTHKPTGPAQWLAEAGLSPKLKYEIAMVVRTYPIRVAGNSGPMPNEIDWVKLARRIDERLLTVGGPTTGYVDPAALQEWENACQMVGAQQPAPHVSEFHKQVWAVVGSETRKELGKLFEFTTVTKKLRRIAEMDMEGLKVSVRQIRPDYIVLTFLNYVFPELWNATSAINLRHEHYKYIDKLQTELGVPVRYVSTGPKSEHILEINYR